MTDTAGGWLDERLDGDRRWTSTEVGFDVEAEARDLLDQAGPVVDETTPGVISGAESWLAGQSVVEPVEPADEIVLGLDEIEAAIATVDGIAVTDGPASWVADELDPETGEDVIVPPDADSDVESTGVVDPFDVFLAQTEAETETSTTDPVSAEPDADPSDPTADDDVAAPGSDVDDIAPAAESEPRDEHGVVATTGTGDAGDADEAAPPAVSTETAPMDATSSRLDAFDLPDAVDTGHGPTSDPPDDEGDPGDGLDDLLDGGVS